MASQGHKKSTSISRNLTISIVATAVFGILVGTVVFTAYSVNKERSALMQSADEIVDMAAQSLSLPLWYLHTDTISEIASAYAVNPLIVSLKIQDTADNELFTYSVPDATKGDIMKRRAITHKGQFLGSLEMVVSVKSMKSNIYRLLIFGGVACLLVSITLLVLTGFWLRVFLNKPVEQLETLVEDYSGGELSNLTDLALPKEFVRLEKTLRSMAGRINKQVEELALAESRYRSLFQNALEGMFRSSFEGKLITTNPAMAAMLGYDSPEELIASVKDLAHDLYVDPFERESVLKELRTRGKLENHETFFRKKDGTPLSVNIGAVVVMGQGLIQGYCQDITRQVEVREALIAAKEAAEAANQLKTNFLSMVSHELRTPLTSVLGFSKLIDKRLQKELLGHAELPEGAYPKNVKQIQQQLSIIIKEGERLTRLINNVLDLAKLEAGRVCLNPCSCEISELIATALETSQTLFTAKGLTSIMEIAPGLPVTDCDQDRILQVLINLISNAVRFTPEGAITCRAEMSGDSIMVSVEDNGPGIDPEQAAHIFEKFYQLRDTVQDPKTGTGLGLAICRELIQNHGGEIWYENLEPNGCAFRFTLPVTP